MQFIIVETETTNRMLINLESIDTIEESEDISIITLVNEQVIEVTNTFQSIVDEILRLKFTSFN
jgi:uncharacterized protein YlzI (FlbEa/FlbD family)